MIIYKLKDLHLFFKKTEIALEYPKITLIFYGPLFMDDKNITKNMVTKKRNTTAMNIKINKNETM